MKLCSADLTVLSDYAIDAATAAGQYISQTRPVNIEHKEGLESLATQVVTEVDRESQALILAILEPSFAAYDLALLTEESPDDGSRLKRDYFWCIDPIDGTLCFIEGTPGYAVSIALVSRDGTPAIGVVYDPVEHVLYHAISGGGAFRNATPWQPDLSGSDASITIFSDRSETKRPGFEHIANAVDARLGMHGGAVMNAIRCLETPPACYFKPDKAATGGGCFWDFAATSCIYRELGAWVSDGQGAPLDLNRSDSVYLNHCGVMYATDAALARRVLHLLQQEPGHR